jgi:hypothetical protein
MLLIRKRLRTPWIFLLPRYNLLVSNWRNLLSNGRVSAPLPHHTSRLKPRTARIALLQVVSAAAKCSALKVRNAATMTIASQIPPTVVEMAIVIMERLVVEMAWDVLTRDMFAARA